MKRIQIPVIVVIVAIAVFGLYHGSQPAPVKVLAAEASPSPTPVDQKWRVEYGEIEMLEEKLKTLNAAGRWVGTEEITVSSDSKRFVIITTDEPDEEEDHDQDQ